MILHLPHNSIIICLTLFADLVDLANCKEYVRASLAPQPNDLDQERPGSEDMEDVSSEIIDNKNLVNTNNSQQCGIES